ncbi:uncharacterized protein LOC112682162 [Sipha flava]|uniref:Uncharacterized protein LOC112682162 n=1 Tax=Sipha flava TaxID=143950 RepID=A0A8B8FCG0_9HEMI|nr:uncharacterized protein LOC112682162 [Sipha flava]
MNRKILISQTTKLIFPPIDISDTDDSDSDLLSSTSFLINNELTQWAIHYKISHIALDNLLSILRQHKCFITLPKSAKTLLKTKPISIENMRVVDPGKYYHFGLKNGIVRYLPYNNCVLEQELKIVIGIDGLPIHKSTSLEFWPILAYIRPKSDLVFPVGLYCGNQKPSDSNDYLKDFVDEAKYLILNGFELENKSYKVKIDVICCDMPARSFVLKIKSHTGYNSCPRCEIEGDRKENRTVFPYCELDKRPPIRTHNGYTDKLTNDHHLPNTDISILIELPMFDIINDFSLDYMHMLCLGVTKKLLFLWMNGPLNVRLPSWKIKELSDLAINLKSDFPCDFSRKPRKLEEVARFKATEFRAILIYYGFVILKDIIADDCYKNFKALSIAMTILLSPQYVSLKQYARDLLEYFVKSFEQIYGQMYMAPNIHGLLHLVDDYDRFGSLDNCCTFSFKNYMKVLKSMIRKPDKPLEQVIIRYNEGEKSTSNLKKKCDSMKNSEGLLIGQHNKGPLINNLVTNPQFSTLILGNYKLKTNVDADSYFCINNNEIVKLINIGHSTNTGNIVLIGREFREKNRFLCSAY